MADTFLKAEGTLEPSELEGRALREWHGSHSAWLHGFLCRTLRLQPSDADDIVQDTWLRVIRTSLGDVEHPRAYLSRIALNLFRDRYRRDKRRIAHLRLVRIEESIDPAAMAEQESLLELERAILDLPESLRDVFVLSRFRRLTNKDIADQLGISVKTVEWRIGKAIELCASRLRS
ncbi:RNA polymerase sigma factor [Sphingopyxis sp. MG]|uniref:RNA polymerase sigma factor n=1 Tax=Sphingopyxis sp. MG TaxID=1866325 RepID=UPI000CDF5554|nr:sigma-70 family RNA polymerase sigma factor [Sphingopyxis sp. MG]AVA13604.1 RNA polymerase sigma factor [Sphingopyxis sp. MG]